MCSVCAHIVHEVFFFFSLSLPPHPPWNADVAQILHATLKALREGQVIAVPTDTLYGLACLAQNSEAIGKVYDIKGRNGSKPLAICVGEVHDIYKCVFCDLLLHPLFKLLQHLKSILFQGIVKWL